MEARRPELRQPRPVLLDCIPAGPRVVLITANPTAGARAGHTVIEKLIAELRFRSLEPRQVENLELLSILAPDLLSRGELRAVVAAGGDGTIAEVVNRTPQGTAIAVLPLGTENLLANYLEIGAEPAALAELIAQGQTAWVDAGRANGRLFMLMASVGFDAEVVRRLHATRSGNIRRWSYAKPILHTIRSYRYPELRVKCAPARPEDTEAVVACRWAFVFNVPRYGFGLKFAPHSEGTDGKLDLCAFKRGGFWRGMRYLAEVIFGRHRQSSDFVGIQATSFRIESDVEVPYEIDGDPGGVLPLTIEIVPRRVRLLVAKTWSIAAK
jgi:diacylglycerol kinase (ATP)